MATFDLRITFPYANGPLGDTVGHPPWNLYASDTTPLLVESHAVVQGATLSYGTALNPIVWLPYDVTKDFAITLNVAWASIPQVALSQDISVIIGDADSRFVDLNCYFDNDSFGPHVTDSGTGNLWDGLAIYTGAPGAQVTPPTSVTFSHTAATSTVGFTTTFPINWSLPAQQTTSAFQPATGINFNLPGTNHGFYLAINADAGHVMQVQSLIISVGTLTASGATMTFAAPAATLYRVAAIDGMQSGAYITSPKTWAHLPNGSHAVTVEALNGTASMGTGAANVSVAGTPQVVTFLANFSSSPYITGSLDGQQGWTTDGVSLTIANGVVISPNQSATSAGIHTLPLKFVAGVPESFALAGTFSKKTGAPQATDNAILYLGDVAAFGGPSVGGMAILFDYGAGVTDTVDISIIDSLGTTLSASGVAVVWTKPHTFIMTFDAATQQVAFSLDGVNIAALNDSGNTLNWTGMSLPLLTINIQSDQATSAFQLVAVMLQTALQNAPVHAFTNFHPWLATI